MTWWGTTLGTFAAQGLLPQTAGCRSCCRQASAQARTGPAAAQQPAPACLDCVRVAGARRHQVCRRLVADCDCEVGGAVGGADQAPDAALLHGIPQSGRQARRAVTGLGGATKQGKPAAGRRRSRAAGTCGQPAWLAAWRAAAHPAGSPASPAPSLVGRWARGCGTRPPAAPAASCRRGVAGGRHEGVVSWRVVRWWGPGGPHLATYCCGCRRSVSRSTPPPLQSAPGIDPCRDRQRAGGGAVNQVWLPAAAAGSRAGAVGRSSCARGRLALANIPLGHCTLPRPEGSASPLREIPMMIP